jgi:hypothetical protein
MIVDSFLTNDFYGLDYNLVGGNLIVWEWLDLSRYVGFGSQRSLRMRSLRMNGFIWWTGAPFRVHEKKFWYQARTRFVGSRFVGCCPVLLSVSLQDLPFVDYLRRNSYRPRMWVKVGDFRIDEIPDDGFIARYFQRITDVLQLSRIFRRYKVKQMRR